MIKNLIRNHFQKLHDRLNYNYQHHSWLKYDTHHQYFESNVTHGVVSFISQLPSNSCEQHRWHITVSGSLGPSKHAYPTGRKFSLEFKFCSFANGNLLNLNSAYHSYNFSKYLNDSLYNWNSKIKIWLYLTLWIWPFWAWSLI